MRILTKRSATILLIGFLLLVILAFRPPSIGTSTAMKKITFVSPLPVTPVVEIRTLTLSSALPPLTTTTTLIPTLPHDLIFVNETGLMRWHHAEQQLETVVATTVVTSTSNQEPWHTVEYKTSPDQRQVLVAYGMGIIGEGGTFYLALYEPATAHLTTLMTTTHVISDFMLAPDGSWAAYLLRDVYPKRPWWRNLFHKHACGCEEIYLATVYLLRLQSPYTPQPMRVCGRASNGLGECGGLDSLLSDQSELVWRDGAGYWTADPVTGTVRFLAEYSQPAIGLPALTFATEPASTSPYALSWIAEPAALTYGIFNRQSWTVTKLPAQNRYSVRTSSLHYLPDKRLLWVKAADGGPRQPATLEVWTLDEHQMGTPIRRQIWQLPWAIRDYVLKPALLDEGRVALSIEGPARISKTAAGLYWVDLKKGWLTKVNNLPAPPTNPEATLARAIEWSPDGLGALYLRETLPSGALEVTYVPANGASLLELGTTFGQQAEQITWLLPTTH